MTASILDYLGKFEGGIMVSVSIMQNEKYYDGIFYYTANQMIITIDEKLQAEIGDIELREDYIPFMESIIRMVEPYGNIIEQLQNYDPTWNHIQ